MIIKMSIREACKRGDLETVKKGVEFVFEKLENDKEEYVKHICGDELIVAAREGHLNIVEYLYYKGFTIRYYDYQNGVTEYRAVIEAARNGHIHILDYFWNDITIDYGNCEQVLEEAVKAKQWDAVKYFIEKGVSTSKHAFIEAIRSGNLEMVKLLDVGYRICGPPCPINIAIEYDHVEVTKYLQKKYWPWPYPITELIRHGSIKILKDLLSSKKDFEFNVIQYAINCENRFDIVLLLLDCYYGTTNDILKEYFYPYIWEIVKGLKVTQRFHPYLILEIVERLPYTKWFTSGEMFGLITEN